MWSCHTHTSPLYEREANRKIKERVLEKAKKERGIEEENQRRRDIVLEKAINETGEEREREKLRKW